MKNGKRPTKKQKMQIIDAGWNPDNWLVTKNLPDQLHLVHRNTNKEKVITTAYS